MKTLTDIADTQRLSTGQDVFWLFEIDWPDATRGYATRGIFLVGIDYQPRILGIERQTVSKGNSIPPSRLAGENIKIRLSNIAGDTDRISLLARQTAFEGLPCRLRLFFKDPDGTAGAADSIEVFWGKIESIDCTSTEAEIQAADLPRVQSRSILGRILDGDLVSDLDPESEGAMAPWIFGLAPGAPLLPLRNGPSARLRSRMSDSDDIAFADSLEGFPSSGSIQIGGEILDYEVIDADALSFGTLTSALTRESPAAHSAGSIVRLVPAGGFEFLAADHPCLSVANVKADGAAVDSGDYSAEEESIGGRSVQKVVFDAWPTRTVPESPPSQLILRGSRTENYWEAEAANTAYNPLNAIDGNSKTTVATVYKGGPLLSLAFKNDLRIGDVRYGTIVSAKLFIRYFSDLQLAENTVVNLRIAKGAYSTEFTLPHHTQGQPDLELEFSFTSLAGIFGWNFFSDKGGWPVVQVEMTPLSENASVLINDLAWRIDYEPNQEERMADTITADISGLAAGDDLIESPADVIEFLLTDSRAAGIDSQRLDAESFSSVKSQLNALGYKFCSRIDRPAPIERLLAEALFESRSDLILSGDKIKLLAPPRIQGKSDSDFDIDASVLLDFAVPLAQRPAAGAVNDLAVLYASDFSLARSKRHSRSLDKRIVSISGVAPPRRFKTVAARWLGDVEESVVTELICYHLSRRAHRGWSAEIVCPLIAAHLDLGDRASLTHAPGDLDEAGGRIAGWGIDELDRVRLDILLDAGPWTVWSDSAGVFIRQMASGTRLEVVIDGSVAARIDMKDGLGIAGETIEESLGAAPMSSAIEYDEATGRIYFGAGSGVSFEAGFAIDSSGNLLLRGQLVEQYTMNAPEMASCWTSSEEYFALSSGGSLPEACYDAPSAELRLRHTITEGL
jgi:hypothetical protein